MAASEALSADSLVIQLLTALLFPFMLLFGFYIIINGHYTPGGGFQGSSILASLFVARYVVYPLDDIGSRLLHTAQRLFLTLIVLIPPVLLFSGCINSYPVLRPYYLTLMDCLIGIQVGFGLGVAVLQFAFFKGVGQSWLS